MGKKESLSLTDKINDLNSRGIQKADEKNFDESIQLHNEASRLSLSDEVKNIDYHLLSRSGFIYSHRKLNNNREFAESALEMTSKFAEDKGVETYFGSARLLEELGLVMRYSPQEEFAKDDLNNTFNTLKKAKDNYQLALENKENEIVSEEKIKDKLYRSSGLISAVATEIVEKFEDINFLGVAVDYAKEEVDSRIKNGESSGFDVMNAYHTLGTALTVYVKETDEGFTDAKDALNKAKELIEDDYLASVVNLRLAWLQYDREDTSTSEIESLMDSVIEHHKTWSIDVKDVLKEKVLKVGDSLGGEYQAKTQSLYDNNSPS